SSLQALSPPIKRSPIWRPFSLFSFIKKNFSEFRHNHTMMLRSFVLLLLLLPFSALAGELVGKVVHVSDGDSMIVLTNGAELRVRIDGIQAQDSRKAYNHKSRPTLSVLVAGKTATVL